MNLLLKYKDKIVSFGLLPIIITLIGIHIFPTSTMLGIGLGISIVGVLYDVLRLKGLNFFLLQGTIGIGTCFLLRLFTGYEYIPRNSLTPTLEFMLLVCAFIHITAPELYRNFLKRFHLNFTSSCMLEAKLIVILSSIHLLILFSLHHRLTPFSPEHNFGVIYLIPTLIYILCLIINIVGIQVAAIQTPQEKHVIRSIPICNGKVYLTPIPHTEENHTWDAPMKSPFEGPLRKSQKYARHIVKQSQSQIKNKHAHPTKDLHPRLILSYRTQELIPTFVQLYILPIIEENEINLPGGRFFTFEEIKKNPEIFSHELMIEHERLQLVAQVWKEFK